MSYFLEFILVLVVGLEKLIPTQLVDAQEFRMAISALIVGCVLTSTIILGIVVLIKCLF